MTHAEKAQLLQDTIIQLYCKEGRSKSYIADILHINRRTIQEKIKEWNLIPAEPRRHLTPSNQKFLNKNKQLIQSRLDNDASMTSIAEELHLTRKLLLFMIQSEPMLQHSYQNWQKRAKERHEQRIERQKSISARCYEYQTLPNERWKPILGFENYEVSDHGRIRRYASRYKAYYLLCPTENKENHRLYIRLTDKNGKSKNLQVANITAHAFVTGYDKIHCTVNHKDGNVQNNHYNNLEWTTQSENNLHAYQSLHRKKVTPSDRRYSFKKIVYQNKYEFKTIAALARFLNKSETQTRRYLEKPEKHQLTLIL